MSKVEIFTCIVSGVAIIVSIISLVVTNKIAAKSNLIIMGQTETQLRSSIRETHRDFLNYVSNHNNTEEQYELCYNSLIEQYLNAYDDACQLFLDGKLDKSHFSITTYGRELKNIIGNFPNKYKANTDYTATLEFYWELNNNKVLEQKYKEFANSKQPFEMSKTIEN